MADIAITDVDSTETKIQVIFLKGELSGTPIYQLRCAWGTGSRGTNQSGGCITVHAVVIR